MKINDGCKTQLIKKLNETIKTINSDNYLYLHYILEETLSPLDDILPVPDHKAKAKTKLFEEILGPNPFSTFIRNQILKHIRNNKYGEGEFIKTLASSSYVEDLVNQFCSLPNKYRLFIPLRSRNPLYLESENKIEFKDCFPNNYLVGDSIRIFISDESLNHSFKFPTKDDTFQIYSALFDCELFPTTWPVDDLILEVEVDGYIDEYTTITTEKAYNKIKSFLGLSFVVGLFTKSYGPPWPYHKKSLFVFEQKESSSFICQYFPPDNEVKILSSLILSTEIRDIDAEIPKRPLNAGIYGTFPPMSRENRIEEKLHLISKAFSDEDTSDRIRRAAEWYFESHCGTSETLQIVQLCTAFEILLGDQTPNKQMTLSELLSNRCAYLLGRSPTDRKEIVKMFTEASAAPEDTAVLPFMLRRNLKICS